MDLFKILNRESRDQKLRFLVIGGHAINAHGYERQTADVDILFRREDSDAWKKLLTALGYEIFHEQNAFIQFTPPEFGFWPVDLMCVNAETFEKMYAELIEVDFQKVKVKIPSLEHLIALKLHALKNTNERRELKDLSDIVTLIEVNRMDIKSRKFKELFANVMPRQKSTSKSSPPRPSKRRTDKLLTLKHTLEFPDGKGFVSKRVRMGLDAIMKLSEERLPWFNSQPGAQERRLRTKCHVMFEL